MPAERPLQERGRCEKGVQQGCLATHLWHVKAVRTWVALESLFPNVRPLFFCETFGFKGTAQPLPSLLAPAAAKDCMGSDRPFKQWIGPL